MSAQYGGALLTVLLSIQFIVVGGSFLLNYLYRAVGPVAKGSLALFAEGLFRVPFMILLLLWIGLPGIPIASIISASIFGFFAYRWTVKEVRKYSQPTQMCIPKLWVARVAILLLGVAGCIFFLSGSWIHIIFVGSSISVVGLSIFVYLDPQLVKIRLILNSVLVRLRKT